MKNNEEKTAELLRSRTSKDLWDTVYQECNAERLLFQFPPNTTYTFRFLGPFVNAKRLYIPTTIFSKGYVTKKEFNEFKEAAGMSADLIGINNRDLKTLRTDLKVTEKIMREAEPPDMMVVSESGIETAIDIRFLRNCGAEAFLIGSAIMASKNPESKVRELVQA